MMLQYYLCIIFVLMLLNQSSDGFTDNHQNEVKEERKLLQAENLEEFKQSSIDQLNTHGRIFTLSQHEDLFLQQQFEGTEYEPRMEVTSLGIVYNNHTATLHVTVFVGIPAVHQQGKDRSQGSTEPGANVTVPSYSTQVGKFTNYEIYLSATHEEDISSPPSSCLSSSFLQHSFRDVSTKCTQSMERKSFPSEEIHGETLCIDNDANNFTVSFRHVYSAFYCILIQPKIGDNTQRTFSRMIHLQTHKLAADITDWQTTIDLQTIPKRQSILAAFTLPDAIYEVDSNRFRIDLLQVSGEKCNNQTQIKVIGSKIVTVDPTMKAYDTEFMGEQPGLYCTVVIPIDERCDGNGFWKIKGKSCARHSAKSVLLVASPTIQGNGESTKAVTFLKSNRFDIWTTIAVICCFFFGLVLISILSILVVFRKRRQKRFRRRQGILYLEPSQFTEMVQTDSWMNMKHLQSIPNFDHNKELVPVSVLLLYRRDDAETSLRAAQLRKQLQSEYSDRIKIFDYGDETQWEDIALEGSDWLPRRINGSTTCEFSTRIIVIHSSEESHSKPNLEKFYEPIGEAEISQLLLSKTLDRNADEIISLQDADLTANNSLRSSTDKEFFYGLKLLQNYMFESSTSASENSKKTPTSLYRRVFNVRFSDLIDRAVTRGKNQELVYPHLQLSPFTCYFLPGHYNQLAQHIFSSL